MKTYRIAPRELQNSAINARPNSPKTSPKGTMASKLRTVRNKTETGPNTNIYGSSNLVNLFEYKFNGSKNREKKQTGPASYKNTMASNASGMNDRKSTSTIGKNAKEFISD